MLIWTEQAMTMPSRTLALLFLILPLCPASPVHAVPPGESPRGESAQASPDVSPAADGIAAQAPPIQSRADLERYLESDLDAGGPLSRLSQPGLDHFLDGVRFTDSGLVGFDPLVLQTELAPAQIRQVLDLVGMQEMALMIRNSRPGTGADREIDTGLLESYYRLNGEFDEISTAAFENDRQIAERDVAERLDRFLAAHVPSGDVSALAADEAELAFRAVLAANFWAPGLATPMLVELAERVDALRDAARSADTAAGADPLRQVYEVLVHAREFRVAGNFARRHGIEPFPWAAGLASHDRADDGAASYLRFHRQDGGGIGATRVSVDLDSGPWMVAEVHPGCAFSRRALEHLGENTALIEALPEDRILWVVNQSRSSEVPSFVAWNEQSPGPELTLAYRNQDWPQEIAFLGFPVFRFLQDGVLVKTVTGWPDDGQGEQIREGIRLLSDRPS